MAKILIVEDDKLIRDGLVDMLRSEGDHEVLDAKDGKAGLALALEEKPDLIITDVRMPKMTGIEMVAELRKDKWGEKAKVIITSNDDMVSTVNEALSVGVSTYLSKVNVDRADWMQQINAALNS